MCSEPSTITHLKMKSTVAFVIIAVLSISMAEDAKPTVKVLNEKSFVREDGYNFEFSTSDGVSRQEQGELISVGDQKGIGVKGSYSYTAPDGQHYVVNFVADDKGYRPELRIVSPDSQSQTH